MFFKSVDYVSSARLFVTAEGGTSVGESYQNNLFAEGRVNSYAQIATSEQVAIRASEALGGAISPGDLRSRTTALPVEDTVILDISVSGPSPQRAQSYAAAIAQQTVEVVQELETSRRGGVQAASAILYDEPGLPGSKGKPWILWTGVGAGAGLAVGVVVALLLGWRRWETVVDEVTAVDTTHHPVLAELSPRTVDPAELGSADHVDDDAASIHRLHNLIRFLGGRRDQHVRAPRVLGFTAVGKDANADQVAARFARTVAETGNTVLLIDGDLSGKGLTGGTALSADHGLSTLLTDSVGSVDPFIEQERLTILPAGPAAPDSGVLVSNPRLQTILDDLRDQYDYVVIACPPMGPTSDSIVYSALADAMVVVVRSGSATRRSLRDNVAAIELVGSVVGTVLVSGRPKTADVSSSDESIDVAVEADEDVPAEDVLSVGASEDDPIRTVVHGSRNGSGPAAPVGSPSDGRGR
ncbi:putative protein-tyrosine kinase [Gordonia paraffinivorans NBRC 108238]|uniref:AAA domain-containing protein n=1 Tax=Gordonia paraffinivorans NBRC 108238 TaxID=1223543 RepID=A0ABQ0INS7_9ACTN|nr:polysaccharide biosynthesis tyrosine autokinase [Gordonia paraffinivorans]GAC84606.1 putative protein-tyrosine kinase [Gordonia paraffinivorans NBRC 108238]